MIYREQRIESWEAEHRSRIKWGCEKVGMADVSMNIIRHNKGAPLVLSPSGSSIVLHYSDSMRTTRGRAWTHYGPHDYHNGSSALVQKQLQAFHGKPRGGLLHWCIALYETASDEDREENCLHELAHILANLEAGKRVGHKAGWKRMMRRLGITPKRCHSQDVSHVKRKQRRYLVLCPDSCGWSFKATASRRTRRLNDSKGRHCPKCKAPLLRQHWMNAKEIS